MLLSFEALGNSYLRVPGVLGLERHLETRGFALKVNVLTLRGLGFGQIREGFPLRISGPGPEFVLSVSTVNPPKNKDQSRDKPPPRKQGSLRPGGGGFDGNR